MLIALHFHSFFTSAPHPPSINKSWEEKKKIFPFKLSCHIIKYFIVFDYIKNLTFNVYPHFQNF